MYKVCMVEADPTSRKRLARTMQCCKRFELAGAYGTGQEALRELPKVKPDVVLMDLKLQGMSGIECLIALRQLSPPCNCPVLILTEYDDFDSVFDALKSGANGYLLKRHTSGKELQAAIVEVMAGGGPMSRSIARKVIAYFSSIQQREWSASQCLSLTLRENEVIRCFSNGLLYKETADVLGISYSAVHKHQHKIFLKLKVTNRSEAIRKWWDMGCS